MDNWESTYHQLSKALCNKENATCKELLQVVDQLKNRVEPKNRVLTLEEVKEHISDSLDVPSLYMDFPNPADNEWWEHWTSGSSIKQCLFHNKSRYGITWRCWLRKPTDEEHAAVPWEV